MANKLDLFGADSLRTSGLRRVGRHTQQGLGGVTDFLRRYAEIPILDADGNRVTVLGRRSGSGPVASDYPFRMSRTAAGVYISYGTWGGIAPTIDGGGVLVADRTLNELAIADDPADGHVYAEVTMVDDDQVLNPVLDTVVIKWIQGAVPSRSDADVICVEIGTVVGQTPANALCSSQQWFRLGPPSAVTPAAAEDYSTYLNIAV